MKAEYARIYLDVDGVFNAVTRQVPDWGWDTHKTAKVNGYPIMWSPEFVAAINTAATTPGVGVYWLTTWCHDAPQILAPALGIDGADWPVVGYEHWQRSLGLPWWKHLAIVEHLDGFTGPVLWVDDDHGVDAACVAWLAGQSQILAMAPDTGVGVTRAEADIIQRFVSTLPQIAAGDTCMDLCASCSSAVRTFANLQVVGDEKHLLPTYMPPGGCTCQSMTIDSLCPRCFPAALLCQACGDDPTTFCTVLRATSATSATVLYDPPAAIAAETASRNSRSAAASLLRARTSRLRSGSGMEPRGLPIPATMGVDPEPRQEAHRATKRLEVAAEVGSEGRVEAAHAVVIEGDAAVAVTAEPSNSEVVVHADNVPRLSTKRQDKNPRYRPGTTTGGDDRG